MSTRARLKTSSASRRRLEERGASRGRRRPDGRPPRRTSRAPRAAVDGDAFSMSARWGEVASRAIPGGAQGPLDHSGDRSLAVRAADHDRANAAVGVVELFEQRGDLVQTELDAELLEREEILARCHAGAGVARRVWRSRKVRPIVAFSSRRSTTTSIMPWSSRNSLRWNPGGRRWRMVSSMTRGPANPISALGSAMLSHPASQAGRHAARRVGQHGQYGTPARRAARAPR